jgi:hypothetical protein
MKADPSVADIRVTIMVRDLPIADLRDLLAEVLNLTWSEEKGASLRAYRLARSEKDLREERELPMRGEQAFRRAVEEAIRWTALPKASQDRLLNTDLLLAQTIHQPGGLAAMRIVAGLTKAHLEQILAGKSLTFPAGAVPPSLREHSGELYRALNAQRFSRGPIPPESALTIGRTTEGADSALGVGFSWKSPSGSGSVALPLQFCSSRTVMPEVFGLTRTEKAYAHARKPYRLSKPPQARNLDDLFEQIADEMQVNIIAERYFESRALRPPEMPKDEASMEELMDRALGPRNGFWWVTGGTCLVQKRNWWEARLSQVPDATLQRMRDIFKQETVTLEHWGEVGTLLRVEQVGRIETERIASLLGFIEDKLPVLSFFGHLSATDRAASFSDKGLNWATLLKADQARAAAWLGIPEAEIKKAASDGSVRIFALVRPSAPPMERTLFRAVARGSVGAEKVLRETFAPGDPPASYHPRATD